MLPARRSFPCPGCQPLSGARRLTGRLRDRRHFVSLATGVDLATSLAAQCRKCTKQSAKTAHDGKRWCRCG